MRMCVRVEGSVSAYFYDAAATVGACVGVGGSSMLPQVGGADQRNKWL